MRHFNTFDSAMEAIFRNRHRWVNPIIVESTHYEVLKDNIEEV